MFAVKLINKAFAQRRGNVTQKDLAREASIHDHVSGHHNVISYFATGEDALWRWIAMEYAEGGDLFDKIEADDGVPEDVAHCYFMQLIAATQWLHSKGVAHRDIKPENILLSGEGLLKVADFGQAVLFQHDGKERRSTSICGSPPYVAPEVIQCYNAARQRPVRQQQQQAKAGSSGYRPDRVDVWSCGIVLFVLLVGNTPWEVPTTECDEYREYLRTGGRSAGELWQYVPADAASLVRGMLRVDPDTRWMWEEVKYHPWVTRSNPYISHDGKMKSGVLLATRMLENLKIDFNRQAAGMTAFPCSGSGSSLVQSSQLEAPGDTATGSSGGNGNGAEDIWARSAPSTQPETPTNDMLFDWDLSTRVRSGGGAGRSDTYAHSQPVRLGRDVSLPSATGRVRNPYAPTSAQTQQQQNLDATLTAALSEDPSMSQFSESPSVPLSVTQGAKAFNDIIPSYSLTRFVSHLPHRLLLPMLAQALHRLSVPTAPFARTALQGREARVGIKTKATDSRRCMLDGYIIVEQIGGHHPRQEAREQAHEQRSEEGEDSVMAEADADVRTGDEAVRHTGGMDHDDDVDDDGDGGEWEQDAGLLLEVNFVKVKGDPLEWRRFFKQVVVLCKDAVYIPR